MSSNDSDDIDMRSEVFTLEDTYDNLVDIKNQKVNEMKKLITVINNNEARPLPLDITPDEIRQKRLKYMESVQKFVSQEQPKDGPVILTLDFYTVALRELESEIHKMQELEKVTDEEIAEIEADIS